MEPLWCLSGCQSRRRSSRSRCPNQSVHFGQDGFARSTPQRRGVRAATRREKGETSARRAAEVLATGRPLQGARTGGAETTREGSGGFNENITHCVSARLRSIARK